MTETKKQKLHFSYVNISHNKRVGLVTKDNFSQGYKFNILFFHEGMFLISGNWRRKTKKNLSFKLNKMKCCEETAKNHTGGVKYFSFP